MPASPLPSGLIKRSRHQCGLAARTGGPTRLLLLGSGLDQLLGMAQGFGSDALARQHAPDLARALFGRQFLDRGLSATTRRVFLDIVVMVGETGDLREVSDA